MNSMAFADGACEARSRSEEEAMSGTSATTSDTEIGRNPHQPEGWWRRNSIDFFVAPPPRYTLASRRRRFANSTPSRSPQTPCYSWDETLSSPARNNPGSPGQAGEFSTTFQPGPGSRVPRSGRSPVERTMSVRLVAVSHGLSQGRIR